jgi:hypothetical protein
LSMKYCGACRRCAPSAVGPGACGMRRICCPRRASHPAIRDSRDKEQVAFTSIATVRLIPREGKFPQGQRGREKKTFHSFSYDFKWLQLRKFAELCPRAADSPTWPRRPVPARCSDSEARSNVAESLRVARKFDQ